MDEDAGEHGESDPKHKYNFAMAAILMTVILGLLCTVFAQVDINHFAEHNHVTCLSALMYPLSNLHQ